MCFLIRYHTVISLKEKKNQCRRKTFHIVWCHYSSRKHGQKSEAPEHENIISTRQLLLKLAFGNMGLLFCSSPAPKIVFQRLNTKRFLRSTSPKEEDTAEGFTPAHEENVRFVYEGEATCLLGCTTTVCAKSLQSGTRPKPEPTLTRG